ncbi:STAS-like domain-containing protein [Vibrio sp. 10N.222.49.C9]|uniref:STAS-like domain-containing protein n=1 Tax=Vibrio sp. 10N.222.49.C9 TaxID=3229615 RepID=UPI0035515A08
MKKIISVIKEFSDMPYGRYRFDAPGSEKTSGEIFREQYIRPVIEDKQVDKLVIDFRGETLYVPSFINEAIGGIIRKSYLTKEQLRDKISFLYPKETDQVEVLVERSIEQAVFGTEPEGYEPDPTRDGTTEL